MSLEINKLFQPCQPNDFYGLRDHIKSFSELVERKKKGESQTSSILIIGNEGTGKSSLLQKLSTTVTGRKDVAQIIDLIPEEESLAKFFQEWKNKIDEISPDWRSLLEKVGKKKLGDDLPILKEQVKLPSGQSYTEYYVNRFIENLDKINLKLQETDTSLYFFFDNIHYFKLLDFHEFYPIFASIIKEINQRDFNIFTIFTFNEEYLFDFDYEKYLTTYSSLLKVEPLTVSETEIYLRRIAPQLINKGVLDLVTNSQRTFFDLNLGVVFINSDLGIDNFVERDLKSLFDLSDDEEEALYEMASYNENLFPIEQLTAYVNLATLKQLEEKGFLWIGENNTRLVQESLLSTLKFRLKLFGPLTTLMVKLDSTLENLENNIAPSTQFIENAKQLAFKIRDRLSYFAVASKIQTVANLCIQKEMFQRAYDFSIINAEQFEHINELEQAGGFCEKIAREFEEKNYYFAARLYLKSASYYNAVEEELKAKRSFTRAADQFEKLAASLPVEKSEYAVRGYLKWCLDCYTSVGDESNFERIRKKAISLYDEESIHHNYFNSMKYEKTKEVIIEEIEPEPPEVEDISIENIEKELEEM
ncbi:MAG: ATP-binding protein [Candidatus Thorarchaeota archaeon]